VNDMSLILWEVIRAGVVPRHLVLRQGIDRLAIYESESAAMNRVGSSVLPVNRPEAAKLHSLAAPPPWVGECIGDLALVQGQVGAMLRLQGHRRLRIDR